MNAFAPLTDALDQLAQSGRCARFWLRDDDAVTPSDALDQLLGLTEAHDIPCLLAVIPAETGQPLADRLKAAKHIRVGLHGWSHTNHAAPPAKACELGGNRTAETVWAELAEGRQKLQSLHASRYLPILVPPWNRIAPEVIPGLPGLGFAALSVFGPEQPAALPCINTHVDLIDWRGSRGGRETGVLVTEILEALSAGVSDIGFLTHHLVHDDAAWQFLAAFFALTAQHPGAQWRDPADLLQERA